jgi:hypothetical protein
VTSSWDQVLTDLELIWFFGGSGLVLGTLAGWRLGRARATAGPATWAGAVIGLACGIGLDLPMFHDITTSRSSTAAIGVLLMPFPPLTNMATALAATPLVWSVAGGLAPEPRS